MTVATEEQVVITFEEAPLPQARPRPLWGTSGLKSCEDWIPFSVLILFIISLLMLVCGTANISWGRMLAVSWPGVNWIFYYNGYSVSRIKV